MLIPLFLTGYLGILLNSLNASFGYYLYFLQVTEAASQVREMLQGQLNNENDEDLDDDEDEEDDDHAMDLDSDMVKIIVYY